MENEKNSLRQHCRNLLRQACPLSHKTFSDHLETLETWHLATTVLIYAPLPGEIDLTALPKIHPSKTFLFPKVEGRSLLLYRWHPGASWIAGPFGLKEPDPDEWKIAPVREVDLALVPGLAFDPTGKRLGRGRGFYDRLLSLPEFRGVKIGVLRNALLLPSIPVEPHDVIMDAVITESEILLPEGSRLDKRGKSS